MCAQGQRKVCVCMVINALNVCATGKISIKIKVCKSA